VTAVKNGALSVGVDVGGTFTDIINLDSGTGALSVLKVPTSKNPSSAIVAGLVGLGVRAQEVALLSHATTIATNALLTHTSLARTALVTNEGFRDVLEIGRQRRPELYDLYTRRPTPLVRRRDRFTVRCRIAADGTVIEPLDGRSATWVARKIIRTRFESVAVCFLNSYVKPAHETKMRRILVKEGFRGHISLSSEVDREFREYERTSTAVVNASLAPLMSHYLSSLSASLHRKGLGAPIYVMNSDGGMGTIHLASERPVSAIESGPAAGVLASRRLVGRLGLRKALTFDMGGTTAKAGTVIDGEPGFTSEFEAAGRTHSGRSIIGSGYAVRGSFIDLAEVSAGGGTIAWVDEGGALAVGPRSAGSEPGPACYGRGGSEPTVTDANVVLGRLNPAYLLGGKMPIHHELASKSFRRLSATLGLTLREAAAGVVRLANNSMAKAISIVTLERGRDPRDFAMVSFGGAGPMHCCDLAEEAGIGDIAVPVHAGLFSAYGLLSGELARNFKLPIASHGASLSVHFRDLEKTAAKEMRNDGFERFATHRYFEARYRGQSHELELPYAGAAALRRSFDRKHREIYGYASPDPIEVVGIRVRAVVERRGAGRLSSSWESSGRGVSKREAWFAGKLIAAPVYTREKMRPGQHGVGPCIMEEYDSTLVVNPSWRWTVEGWGTRLRR